MIARSSPAKFLAFDACSSSSTQKISSYQRTKASRETAFAQSLSNWTSNRTNAALHSSRAFRNERATEKYGRGYLLKGLNLHVTVASKGSGISLHPPTEEQIVVEQSQARPMTRPGSTEAERIEVLDMDEYFSGDVGRISRFCDRLREQSHTVGFFYVKSHGVPQELCDSFLQLGREFFDLPSELKMQLDYRNSAQFRGYMKVGVENTGGITDFREQLDLGPEEAEDFDIVDGKVQKLVYPVYRRLLGPNQWPPEQLLPDFKSKAEEFMDRMGALSMHLMQAIALSLGLRKDYFDSTFQNSPHYQMKVVRYPPKSENQDAKTPGMFGVGEHSDSGFLSLLLQDAVGGLQAQTIAGEWTDVPPKLGTFVVNLGEMLQLATSGYYLATVHRVQSQTGSTSRYSVPFFFNPRLDTDITALSMVANESVQDVSPLLVQDTLLRKHSKTHGGANKLLPVFGQNTFKSYARSHPDIVREHHADLLQSDGKLVLSKLEYFSPKHPQVLKGKASVSWTTYQS